MNHTAWASLCSFLITAVLFATPSVAQPESDAVHFETNSGLHFFAGGTVTIVEKGADDIYAAGGTISVVATTAEDLIVAGGSVTFKDIEVEDVVTAGGDIEVEGSLGQDLIATGGAITVFESTVVSGDAVLSGGEVILNGVVERSLTATGGEVWIDARIDGDAEVRGSFINFAPGTAIGGDLAYWTDNPVDIPADMTVG